ncbi:protein of unknown function [Blastococcus saxobsidens DD2]|uniref:Uncharacterized protein n=1 Tax=Blastococcus saxobsidens (strain DD2) TaxID=1146883 RepID=H6RQW7_BLASD|nr:protein of unknown function [Blastococcus saxobsidens DD2]
MPPRQPVAIPPEFQLWPARQGAIARDG